MSVPIETEAKLLCPAGLTAADVSAVLERLGLTVRWYEPQMQTDTYFDTKRGVLQAANASLRLRRIGHTHIGTLRAEKLSWRWKEPKRSCHDPHARLT